MSQARRCGNQGKSGEIICGRSAWIVWKHAQLNWKRWGWDLGNGRSVQAFPISVPAAAPRASRLAGAEPHPSTRTRPRL